MAKIAAIILPFRQADRLPGLGRRICDALSLYRHHQLETNIYRGETSVSMLIRVAPDPLSPQPQPSEQQDLAGVACGYYLSSTDSAGGSAQRIVSDIASGGVDALPNSDGVYAFACWDKKHECLITGVDKLGMRPLYWMALAGGGYAIASEIKALVSLADDLRINWAAWEEHLTFGFVFGQHTVFSDIQRFGVAESITFRHDRHQSRTVENFLETIDVSDRPFDDFLQEQGAVFDDAMSGLASLYDAPGKAMLTLSGGFDSRRVLCWLLGRGIRPPAYTVPEVKPDGSEVESAIVRELCRSAGLQGFSVYPLNVTDRIQVRLARDLGTDFESDEHNCSTILAMGVDCHDRVNFDGLGAGSQLSGSFVTSEHFKPGGQARFIAGLPRSVRSWLRLPETDGPPLELRVRAELERWGDNPNRFAYFYLLSRTRREISLSPLSLQANVFESLCPFLDRAMMRSALSFPPARKVAANIQSRLIAAMNPTLGRIPTGHSPDLKNDPRYRIDMGQAERGARLDLLKQASRFNRTRIAWSVGMKQYLRFQGARLIAGHGADQRLGWEFGKAAKVTQLYHFEDVASSPKRYQCAAESLKVAFGQRTDWQKPL